MCSKLEIKNLSLSDISDEESLRKYIICCKKMTSDIKLQNSFQVQRCSNISLPSRFPRKTNSKYIFSIAIAGQNVALTQTASQSDTLWDYTAGKIPTDTAIDEHLVVWMMTVITMSIMLMMTMLMMTILMMTMPMMAMMPRLGR